MPSKECEELRPYLVDFVVGELPAAEGRQEDIEKHLAECSECRSIAEELRGTGRALEAVRTLDTRLRDEVRRSITSRARVEAQLVRATREYQRIAAQGGSRGVPRRAWIILAAGTVLAIAMAAAVGHMGAFTPGSAAEVLTCVGEGMRQEWPKGRKIDAGQSVKVPPGCILCLSLAGGSRADVRGPAEITLGGGDALTLSKGQAYLESRGRLLIGLAPLRSLELAAGSKACLLAAPVDELAASVTILSGSAAYSATGGDGSVELGHTLEVDGRSRTGSVRKMQESDRPHWRKPLLAP